jgi:hypothetical protein
MSFEAALTTLLAGIRVNPSASQALEKVHKTPDTFGPTYSDTYKQLDLFDASLRTSKDTLVLDSEKSLAIWNLQVIKQRGEYSARLKWAQTIGVSGSISWPTPTAHIVKEAGYPAEFNRNTKTLTAAAHLADNLPHSSGSLNPEWVEWLMGVPQGWTDYDS